MTNVLETYSADSDADVIFQSKYNGSLSHYITLCLHFPV